MGGIVSIGVVEMEQAHEVVSIGVVETDEPLKSKFFMACVIAPCKCSRLGMGVRGGGVIRATFARLIR